MTPDAEDWLFGYGSLAGEHSPISGASRSLWARLRGFRRTWNVAMANSDPRHDSKHYVDPVTMERPDIYVAFANIRAAAEDSCIGVAFPVTPASLREFDEREANYRRIDVSGLLAPAPPRRAWTYVGLDEGRDRFETGVRDRSVSIPTEYFGAIEQFFSGAGPHVRAEYDASTDPLAVPQRDLRLIRSDRLGEPEA